MLNVTPNLSEFVTSEQDNILDNEDYIDNGDNGDNADEFIENLNQISKNLIDDIHVFDTDNKETIPMLIDIFDSKTVEKSLNLYIN
ncbi:20049_t:CDS:2 [Cetraspora pellucida]|uniref:20049_t:CDS:1 n=1 Tax=Cetraspora pellucida TaxID=1433469 RepID=A0A9N9AVC4_9GLOM|nr:20049_t:CDS:2 [Cetraspora pellucida]